MKTTLVETTVTVDGTMYTASVRWPRVEISRGGELVGTGEVYYWDHGGKDGYRIEDCAADLGGDVFEALDNALTAAFSGVA